MLDQMIAERAMVLEAQRMGLVVSDADIAAAIRGDGGRALPNGAFIGGEVFACMLGHQHGAIEPFVQTT